MVKFEIYLGISMYRTWKLIGSLVRGSEKGELRFLTGLTGWVVVPVAGKGT